MSACETLPHGRPRQRGDEPWIDDIVNGMSCRVIAMRFLALSNGWRGDKAKRVKNELKALCGMR